MSEHHKAVAKNPILYAIQVATFVAAVAGSYAVNETRTTANEQDIAQIEVRLRRVENEQARQGEQFTSIMALLRRLDNRFERLESSIDTLRRQKE